MFSRTSRQRLARGDWCGVCLEASYIPYMKSSPLFFLIALGAACAGVANAATITQWNFNSKVPDATVTTGVTTPSIGSGTASAIGSTTATFATGSTADTGGGTDNSGWNVSTYPAASASSGTAGVQFAVSTVGYTNITFTFDFRQSGTASRFFQLQVSSNGTTFANVSGGTASFGTAPTPNTATSFSSAGLYSNNSGSGSQQFVPSVSYTFAAGSSIENNANTVFRWVSVFDPANNTSYTGSNSTYNTSGTTRFDLVTVTGTAIPEPSTFAAILGGVALVGVAARRRRSV